MNFIASIQNQQLLIHFDRIIDKASIEISSSTGSGDVFYTMKITKEEFIKIPFAVESGNYTIRVKSESKVSTKQIIIK